MVVGNLKKVNLSSYPFIRVQLLDMKAVNKWHVCLTWRIAVISILVWQILLMML